MSYTPWHTDKWYTSPWNFAPEATKGFNFAKKIKFHDVTLRDGEQQAGLIIDELIGQLEIVIKPLGKYTSKAKFLSGATILGDGEIALILDPNALI